MVMPLVMSMTKMKNGYADGNNDNNDDDYENGGVDDDDEAGRHSPDSAATFPTMSSSVLFSYGEMSTIPFRIVSDTFAPTNNNMKKRLRLTFPSWK